MNSNMEHITRAVLPNLSYSDIHFKHVSPKLVSNRVA